MNDIYKDANLPFSVTPKILPYNRELIRFSSQDKGIARLVFEMRQGKNPYNLTGVTGEVTLVMANGSRFIEEATILDPTSGTVEYILSDEQLRCVGKAKGELILKLPNQSSVAGFLFEFVIEASLKDKDLEPIEEYYFKDFIIIKEKLEGLESEVDDLTVIQVNGAKKDTEGVVHPSLDSRIKADVGKLEAKQGEITSQLAETSYSVLFPPIPLMPVQLGSSEDQSSKINALLKYIPPGAIVELPIGEITIKNTLLFSKPITFRGRGTTRNEGSTVIKAYLPDDSYRKWAISLEKGTETDSDSIVRNVRLENFKLLNANYTENNVVPEHDGINASLTAAVDLEMNNVFIYNFKNGLDVSSAYLSRFTGCRSLGNYNHGFYCNGGSTSLMFKLCYAEGNKGDGFHINGTVYTSLDTCASDANAYGYYLARNRSMTMTSCGSEMHSKCALYLLGNRGLMVNGLFTTGGAINPNSQTASTFAYIDDYNENVVLNGCVEESLSEHADNRIRSIIISEKARNIEINNPKMFKSISRNSNVKVNGIRYGTSLLEGSYFVIGERVVNTVNASSNTGWICTRTGHYVTSARETGKVYMLGQLVNINGIVYECVKQGYSGNEAFESLSVGANGLIADNTVEWKNLGEVSTFDSISDYISRLATAYTSVNLTISNGTGSIQMFSIQKRHIQIVANLTVASVGSLLKIATIPSGSRPLASVPFKIRNVTKNTFVDGYVHTTGEIFIDTTNISLNDSLSSIFGYQVF